MSDNYTLGKYQIIRELGRGAFGIVYEAKDIVLARSVAIKVLHPNLVNDSEFIARFHQEARLAAQLDHPNIVPIHDFDQKNGRYFIVMGLMRNGSIKDLLEKYGPRNSAQTKSIVEQAASGLAFAHERDIIHRDLKPGNILVDEHGFARVSDFGFAKAMSEVSKNSLSMTGGILGTPAYIPPEIWEGKAATPRSDIYSLGCITYEILTGKPLFDGESAPQIMMQHMIKGPQLSDSLNEAWRSFISRCLARDPKDRYQSTGALLEDLQWGLFDVAPSHTSEIVLETLEEKEAPQPEVLHQQDTEAQAPPSSTDISQSEYQQTPISDVEIDTHDFQHNQIDQSIVTDQHDNEYTPYQEPFYQNTLTVGQELEYVQEKNTKKRKWLLAGLAVMAAILFVVVGILLFRGFQKSSNLATNEPPPVELPAPHEPLEDVSKPVPVEPVEPEPEPTRESIWANVKPAKEIVFWHNHSGDREAVLQKIVNDFNATNEYGITVHAEVAGRYSEIYTKMMTVLGTPDVPDIVVGYQNQVAMYQLADAIFDMNTIIDDSVYGLTAENKADYIEAFLDQDVYSLYGNQRLGIAPNRSMEVLYYNLSWLKEMGYDGPPATTEEFKEMACKAVEQPFSKGTGDAEPIGMAMRMDASNMASWVFAFGGDIYDTKTNQFIFDSPKAIEAMTFLQSLAAEGCVRIVDGYNDQIQFGAGKSLFTVASSSGLGIYYPQAIAYGVGEMKWNVAPIPNTGKIKQNIYGASVSIPKSTPERELAAWIFLKYYTSTDVQVYWAENTQYLPVRKSAASKMGNFFMTIPQYKTTWELTKYGAFEPAVPGYDPIRDSMIAAMVTMFENPSSDVKAVMTELNETANGILAEQH
jgi:multiple sugar transport system substrate-binding protein